MAALTVGTHAPISSSEQWTASASSCANELTHGPLVLAFFKVSCPTCQYAFPFLERLEQAYGHKNVRIIGVSQNDPRETANFTKEFGVTFPFSSTIPAKYPAVERLWPHQRPNHLLDRTGRPN